MGPFEQQVEDNIDPTEALGENFSRLFVEYISQRDGISLAEAAARSLSRVFSLFHDIRRNVGIMTAFRHEYPLKENRIRNQNLMSDIRRLGYGFSPVTGGWIEQSAGGQATHPVEEESLVISAPLLEAVATDTEPDVMTQQAQQFQGHLLRLVKVYQQDAALLKLSGSEKVIVLGKDGSTFSPGNWLLNQTASFYTYLHGGGQRGTKFAFECAGDYTRSARMAVYEYLRAKNTN